MDTTDPARSVNGSSLLNLVLSVGGCWLPPDDAGAFSVTVWAQLLGGRDVETIRRWVRTLAIPATKAGDEQLIEVRDMRRFLPRVNDDQEIGQTAPPKRTRKKKG